MPARQLDITGWYNNGAAYPDVCIEFSEGEIIKVHKAVICNANAYFAKISGIEDYSANKPNILMDRSEAVITTIIRSFYGIPFPSAKDLPYEDWVEVAALARECYESAICEQAKQNFLALAFAETDVGEILEMLTEVDRRIIEGKDRKFRKGLTNAVRKHHFHRLIPDERYRKILANDTDLMWQHLDDFAAAAKDSTSPT